MDSVSASARKCCIAAVVKRYPVPGFFRTSARNDISRHTFLRLALREPVLESWEVS